MTDTQDDILWLFALSVPAGSAEITGSVTASTADKAAERAIEASFPLDHGVGIVKGTLTLTPEGVSVGLELDTGLVRFSVELGKDGPELHLEIALDASGVEIQNEERLASWPFAEPQRQAEAQSRGRECWAKSDSSEQRQAEEDARKMADRRRLPEWEPRQRYGASQRQLAEREAGE